MNDDKLKYYSKMISKDLISKVDPESAATKTAKKTSSGRFSGGVLSAALTVVLFAVGTIVVLTLSTRFGSRNKTQEDPGESVAGATEIEFTEAGSTEIRPTEAVSPGDATPAPETASYLDESVKEYYRVIFAQDSVWSVKKKLNESENEKIDSFFERFKFEGDAGNFLPHLYDCCPGLLMKLFGLQPEDQHLLTLEEVIDLMKEVRAESESYTEGDATFYFDDAALVKKIYENYNIRPDAIGGSGMGYETYFLDDEYSELLLIHGTVAVLKYDYESGTVRVSDWWDNGIGITPETAFPYADTSECTVFTLD